MVFHVDPEIRQQLREEELRLMDNEYYDDDYDPEKAKEERFIAKYGHMMSDEEAIAYGKSLEREAKIIENRNYYIKKGRIPSGT